MGARVMHSYNVDLETFPRPSDAAREAWLQTMGVYLYRLKLDRTKESKGRGKTPVYQGSAYAGFEHGSVFRIFFTVVKHRDHFEVVHWFDGLVPITSTIITYYRVAADYHYRTGRHMRQSRQLTLEANNHV